MNWWSQNAKNSRSRIPVASLLVVGFILLCSCTTKTQPIQAGKDNCDYCRMTISDVRFGAEIITAKGKAYKFDDMHCFLSFLRAGSADTAKGSFYLVDFADHQLKPASAMFILRSS